MSEDFEIPDLRAIIKQVKQQYEIEKLQKEKNEKIVEMIGEVKILQNELLKLRYKLEKLKGGENWAEYRKKVSKEYYEAHQEEMKAKRREKYKQQMEEKKRQKMLQFIEFHPYMNTNI